MFLFSNSYSLFRRIGSITYLSRMQIIKRKTLVSHFHLFYRIDVTLGRQLRKETVAAEVRIYSFIILDDVAVGYLKRVIVTPIIILIKIIPGHFIKRRKWWFGPPHQERFDISTMMGRECYRLDPSYQRHVTFACAG